MSTVQQQYLLTIYQPDGPPPDDIGEIMRDVNQATADLKASGAWVFNGGLHPASTATVVRARSGAEALMTDGPYTEGKEHVGGVVIIQAADLDAALVWARRMAEATRLPIEVRPFAFDS
ncbi:hypothetical protein J5X84_36715 [Streptosporangiaceae bacterium NEAU-GS5]|nr:hypothetical protein [Streptosporangiaceae bacterium NEAU-GS5]